MPDRRIIHIGFKLITDTKQLKHYYTEWWNKPSSDKDRSKLKKNFSDAHLAWKLTQTTGGTGFNAAKNADQGDILHKGVQEPDLFMENMEPVFANLSESTASNWHDLDNLISSQAHDWSKLVRLQVETTETKKAPREANQALAAKKQKARQLFSCWSHGLSYNPDPTRFSWYNKWEGNKEKLMGTNMMGFNNRNSTSEYKEGNDSHESNKDEYSLNTIHLYVYT